MGKSKSSKSGGSIQQRHLHSRISFLHQAAAYLATNKSAVQPSQLSNAGSGAGSASRATKSPNENRNGQTRHLLNQLRGVSKKSQIRLGKDVKHSLCKRCDSLLVSGDTSREETRNDSKDSGKPWADVFEIKCKTCGTLKRFPTGQQRSQKVRAKKKPPLSTKLKGKQAPSKRMQQA